MNLAEPYSIEPPPRRHVRFRRFARFLFAGLVTNVGIGVLVALLSDPFSGVAPTAASADDNGGSWIAMRWNRPASTASESHRYWRPSGIPATTVHPRELLPASFRPMPLKSGGDFQLIAQYGWPFRSIGYTSVNEAFLEDFAWTASDCGCPPSGLPPWINTSTPMRETVDRVVPCSPVWSGLVFGSLLWGGVWWLGCLGVVRCRRIWATDRCAKIAVPAQEASTAPADSSRATPPTDCNRSAKREGARRRERWRLAAYS